MLSASLERSGIQTDISRDIRRRNDKGVLCFSKITASGVSWVFRPIFSFSISCFQETRGWHLIFVQWNIWQNVPYISSQAVCIWSTRGGTPHSKSRRGAYLGDKADSPAATNNWWYLFSPGVWAIGHSLPFDNATQSSTTKVIAVFTGARSECEPLIFEVLDLYRSWKSFFAQYSPVPQWEFL